MLVLGVPITMVLSSGILQTRYESRISRLRRYGSRFRNVSRCELSSMVRTLRGKSQGDGCCVGVLFGAGLVGADLEHHPGVARATIAEGEFLGI